MSRDVIEFKLNWTCLVLSYYLSTIYTSTISLTLIIIRELVALYDDVRLIHRNQ